MVFVFMPFVFRNPFNLDKEKIIKNKTNSFGNIKTIYIFAV